MNILLLSVFKCVQRVTGPVDCMWESENNVTEGLNTGEVYVLIYNNLTKLSKLLILSVSDSACLSVPLILISEKPNSACFTGLTTATLLFFWVDSSGN